VVVSVIVWCGGQCDRVMWWSVWSCDVVVSVIVWCGGQCDRVMWWSVWSCDVVVSVMWWWSVWCGGGQCDVVVTFFHHSYILPKFDWWNYKLLQDYYVFLLVVGIFFIEYFSQVFRYLTMLNFMVFKLMIHFTFNFHWQWISLFYGLQKGFPKTFSIE
jgi:hypothetical protein